MSDIKCTSSRYTGHATTIYVGETNQFNGTYILSILNRCVPTTTLFETTLCACLA